MKYKGGHGTYNHSWSGGGLIILSQYIAGIEPVEPAFRRFKVEPNLATLNFVESVVPTRYGNIEMRAEKMDKSLKIKLVVPCGTTAEVCLPKGYAELECLQQAGKSLTLGVGEYEIVAR